MSSQLSLHMITGAWHSSCHPSADLVCLVCLLPSAFAAAAPAF